MAVQNKDITYINKDFNDIRSQLINFSQTYFPNTYTDFSPASPGMMFLEQAAYVSDVLSFYLDNQIQETYLQYARNFDNLYDLAYMFSYKPKATGLAVVDVDFYQQIPAKVVGSDTVPDFDYSLRIGENTNVTSDLGGSFITQEPIDFTVSSSSDPTLVTIAQVNNGEPTYYLLKKTRKAVSGNILSKNFIAGAYKEFPTFEITGINIANVIDITDDDGNEYYEVDYLAQDLVYDSLRNTNTNDPNNYPNTDAPYLLQTKSVNRRFVTRFINNQTLQIQFGAGKPLQIDEEVIPNPDNVGLGLPFGQNKLTTAYSPSNFIFTNTYGVAPSNTTLTVRYLTGGGTNANINANSLTKISTVNTTFLNGNITDTPLAQYVFNSIAVNNPDAASGGSDGDTIDEIRQNSLSNYNTQQRNVTADDYLIRALSMPPKFGVISKAFTTRASIQDPDTILDLYVLTQDVNAKLTKSSKTIKQNLTTYLSQYRMIGDTVNIKDAFIVNIGVEFDIITLPNFNNNEVIAKCIAVLKSHFLTKKWQINQPIILRNITVLLDRIPGVQTVADLQIINKAGTNSGYSEYAYSISSATQGGVIYPSLDPSIFEVKLPNEDIKGRVVSLGTGAFGYGGY
jgi:hypothetical protein|tara:strand:- start:10890 stop:12761 length:1872 start_codon:yes stop_codon:yes gene_type:complete